MSLFFNPHEKQTFLESCNNPLHIDLCWKHVQRTQCMTREPGLNHEGSTQEYWHMAYDVLALVCSTRVAQPKGISEDWIRSTTLDLVRLKDDSWVGP